MLDTSFSPHLLEFTLDRRSRVPLHVQIKHLLLENIRQRAIGEERFFTDEELVKMFNVSRMTVRNAVLSLVQDGALERLHGIGTFVVRGGGGAHHTSDPTKEIRALRRLTDAETTISMFEVEPCPADVGAQLRVPHRAPIRHVQRVRSVGDSRIGVDDFYIPLEFSGRITRVNAKHEILKHILNRHAYYSSDVKMVDFLSDTYASTVLKCSVETPLTMLRMLFKTAGEMHIMYGTIINRSGYVSYSLQAPLPRDVQDPIELISEPVSPLATSSPA